MEVFYQARIFCAFVICHNIACNPSVSIFNAYPRRDLAALLTFGTKKYYKNTIDYGVFKNLTLISSNYDYIVQLIKPPKAGETIFSPKNCSLCNCSMF